MGYRIIAELLRLGVRPAGSGRVKIEDPVLKGYLANMGPSRFEREFALRLPETIEAKHFLDCFGGIADRGVSVEKGRRYPVRAPTSHPVHEDVRSKLFAGLLAGRSRPPAREVLTVMGELMLAAHESYGRCGLGDPMTDLLVELAMAEGPSRGVFGAKASDGGSGGTVVLLIDRIGRAALMKVAAEFGRKEGKARPLIVRGSSPGARALGVRRALLPA